MKTVWFSHFAETLKCLKCVLFCDSLIHLPINQSSTSPSTELLISGWPHLLDKFDFCEIFVHMQHVNFNSIVFTTQTYVEYHYYCYCFYYCHYGYLFCCCCFICSTIHPIRLKFLNQRKHFLKKCCWVLNSDFPNSLSGWVSPADNRDCCRCLWLQVSAIGAVACRIETQY